MPTLKEIDAQISRIPDDARYILWTRKEVRSLPKVLEQGEQVVALTSGFVDNKTWLLVCTDRRVIFLNRGMIYGLKQIQMPLSRINSIDHEVGIAFGSISIWDGATRMTVGTILRGKVNGFVRVAKRAMEEYNFRMSAQFQQQQMQQQMAMQQQQMQMQMQQQAKQRSPEEQAAHMSKMAEHLEKLAALRDKGILTEAEFQAQKAKMLQ